MTQKNWAQTSSLPSHPVFEIQGSDGSIYEVAAPTQEQAVAGFKSYATSDQFSLEQKRAIAMASARKRLQEQDNNPQRLETALRNADAAGDTQAARILAREIQSQRAEQQVGLNDPRNNAGYGAQPALMQSFTLGAADNVLAGAMTPIEMAKGYFSGEDEGKGFTDRVNDAYNRTAEPYQAALDQYRKDYPGRALTADIAGGAGAGIGLLRGGLSATALVPEAAKGFTRGAGLTGAAVADGAAMAGLHAFNEGQDIAESAIIGGGLGLLGGGAGLALEGAGRGLVSAFRSRFGGTDKQAARMLSQAIERTGMSKEVLEQRLADMGPDGFLMDVLGNEGESLARFASNASPQARGALEDASAGRMAGQNERLATSLQDAAGLERRLTPDELINANREQSAPAINEAYSTARAAGHNMPLEPFEPLFQSDMMRKAMREGSRLSKERMIADGGTNNASVLSVFDEAKKTLDGQAVPALGQPQTNEQAIAGTLAKRLRETVDANVPEYAGARQLAQQATRRDEAIVLGAEGGKPSVPMDFQRRVDAMGGQSPQIAQGYAAQKIGALLNSRSTPGATERFFGNSQQMEAMRAALGEQAKAVQKQLGRERTFGTVHRALTGNSTTARQLSDMQRFGLNTAGGATLGGSASYAAGHDPVTGLAIGAGVGAGARGLSHVGRAHMAARSEAVAPNIAKALLSPNLPQQLKIHERAKTQQLLRALITGGSIAPALEGAGL